MIEDAVTLALAAHDGANWDVWGKRRDRYWQAFEGNLRAAAMTVTLGQFCQRMSRKMNCRMGRNAAARLAVGAVLDRGQDAAVLRIFRERANEVTLRVRLVVDERRALFAEREAEEAELEAIVRGDDSDTLGTQFTLDGLDAAPFQPEPSRGD